MSGGRGARPSRPVELTRAEDRIPFLYLEHCTIGRDSNALTATTDSGVVHIPSAALGVLMLGPGTRVTHQAMAVVADAGSSVVWVGENGVRYYAHGRPIGRSTRLLERQAALVSNRKTRVGVARDMYARRFPDEDVSGLTMQQLRGREGARVREVYRRASSATGVEWVRRDYRPDDFEASDPVNKALSAAHACLYGVVHAVIVALGCAPGLGFVHTGHDRAFVYDIADLYKAEVSIPVAFEIVAGLGDAAAETGGAELAAMVRRAVRDAIREAGILTRCVRELRELLGDAPARARMREATWWSCGITWVARWPRARTTPRGMSHRGDPGAHGLPGGPAGPSHEVARGNSPRRLRRSGECAAAGLHLGTGPGDGRQRSRDHGVPESSDGPGIRVPGAPARLGAGRLRRRAADPPAT